MCNSFYTQPYLDTLAELNGNPDYVYCESDGVHVCYKLKDDLYDSERRVRYEFLFEFDKQDYGYGIYYGCKCIFSDGEEDELQQKVDQEWEQLRDGLTTLLNNTFPGKDFLKRAKKMERPINHHYWPFWIRLSDDETIGEIASKVLKDGIYFIYKTRLSGTDNQSGKVSSVPNGSHYTDANNQMPPSATKPETKKPGPKTDTSIVKNKISVQDPQNPLNPSQEKTVNREHFIEYCRKEMIAHRSDSGLLRCICQLLSELKGHPNPYEILKTKNGAIQYKKFCREIVGIEDEAEVKRVSETVRKNKTWGDYRDDCKKEIDKMAGRLGIKYTPPKGT